jgi:molybdopterin-binding protein
LAADRAHLEGAATSPTTTSARNRLRGIVTDVTRDTVMAQVELCCGPYRVVSLMSREAADALGLQPGVVADAVVKATTVVVETP